MAWVALGGNLDDPAATFAAAVRALQALGRVDAASRVWRTAPVGGPADQPSYLNAVVRWRPAPAWAQPGAALAALLAVEAGLGRRRRVPWGPRTIDLDLLDGRGWSSARMRRGPVPALPHPRAAERAFVLVPWAEIAPSWPLATPGAAGSAPATTAVAVRAAALERVGVAPAPPTDAAVWGDAVVALGLTPGVPGDDA